jgi:hypothetical protein
MVTEGLRLWSAAPPLTEEPRTTAGTAGVMGALPFIGAGEGAFAFCTGVEPPAIAGLELATITGVVAAGLVAPAAEAYDVVAGAGEGFGADVLCWLAGDVIRS